MARGMLTEFMLRLLLISVSVLLFVGCSSEKVCLYEQPAGKFCSVMKKCSKGETKDFVEGDDAKASQAGKKTCESLGYDCGLGYMKGRSCSMK